MCAEYIEKFTDLGLLRIAKKAAFGYGLSGEV